jgi:hydrogenase expression/formation protein HypD
VVTERGNSTAQKVIAECFEPMDGYWRGLGKIEKSTLKLKEKYNRFDAVRRFNKRLSMWRSAMRANRAPGM